MSYTEEIYERVVAQNPNEPEFHQAVKEVLDTLKLVIDANEEEYRKLGRLERLVEPDGHVAVDVFRLQGRIAFQRIRRFRNIRLAADVLQAQHFYTVAQYRTDFLQFVGIVGCKHQSTFHKY